MVRYIYYVYQHISYSLDHGDHSSYSLPIMDLELRLYLIIDKFNWTYKSREIMKYENHAATKIMMMMMLLVITRTILTYSNHSYIRVMYYQVMLLYCVLKQCLPSDHKIFISEFNSSS